MSYLAHRLWHRVPATPRAPSAVAAGIHCRHPCLHVPGTDRAHESIDRYSQRSLLFGRHLVPDAYGRAPVFCHRPFGMGPLPHRTSSGSARGSSRSPGAVVRHHHEAPCQKRRRPVPDRRGSGSRSSAVPRAVADAWPYRFVPSGRGRLSDRLLIPEKLYGREREVDTLLKAFDRVVAGGRPELVLVSGYSGIGKSSVVNELHKSV